MNIITQNMLDATKNAVLIFPDGSILTGFGVGKKATTFGEVCFNTAITGYQEILTDPSYSGQIITFTFPHIGNIGVNDDDIESDNPIAKGLIIRENITNPSSYRSKDHLNDWLKKRGLTGICGVDTRQITQIIRKTGAKTVAIIFDDNIDAEKIKKAQSEIQQAGDLGGVELASEASLNKEYEWGSEARWLQTENAYKQNEDKKVKIVAVDYGSKLNILRCLTDLGCEVKVVGAKATYEEIMSHNPDGVFLSNGPGDPAQTIKYTGTLIEKLIENNVSTFGICLGHQLLALAGGAKTKKMYQGHRGANHPVSNLLTKKVEITSQNHGFCVDDEGLPVDIQVTHRSLFDGTIAGIKIKDKNAFSVQYHPESSPGPSDSFYCFEDFVKMIVR